LAEIFMWWPEDGMTNWLDSRSLWNTISPVSGSLIQRFSGMSVRRPSIELIFGRT